MPNKDSIESEIEDIKKMIYGLRDDAPVYPLWTMGQLKNLIQREVKKGRKEAIEELEFVDWQSYGKPRERYDDDLNVLFDPFVEAYITEKLKQLEKSDRLEELEK